MQLQNNFLRRGCDRARIISGIFSCVFLSFPVLFPTPVPADSGEEALKQKLTELRSRVELLEADLESAAGDRWRLFHEFKYGHEEVIPLRLEAREWQRDLLETRRVLDQHVRAHHPEYRAMERDVSSAFEALAALQEQRNAIRRELASAYRAGDESAAARFQEELAEVELVLEAREREARDFADSLAAVRSGLAEQDEQGAEWLQLEQELDAAFHEAMRILHDRIGEEAALRRFETRRIRQLEELRQLRLMVEELEHALNP